MIEEGKPAPAFALRSADGQKVSLADFKGEYVVVYFYPKDDTPGCTREAQGFEEARAKLARLGARVVGISKDTVESHCKFRDKYELGFPLLSDPDLKVIEKYGAFGEKNMYGKKSMGVLRTTVIVGRGGKVAKIFRRVKVNGHVEAVIDAIERLRAQDA